MAGPPWPGKPETVLRANRVPNWTAIGIRTPSPPEARSRGANRISASRLCDLSRVLDVPIDYFFEDMPTAVAAISPATKGRGKAKKLLGSAPDLMIKRETLEFVRAYYKIEDADVRKGVYQLIKVLGPAGV